MRKKELKHVDVVAYLTQKGFDCETPFDTEEEIAEQKKKERK